MPVITTDILSHMFFNILCRSNNPHGTGKKACVALFTFLGKAAKVERDGFSRVTRGQPERRRLCRCHGPGGHPQP